MANPAIIRLALVRRQSRVAVCVFLAPPSRPAVTYCNEKKKKKKPTGILFFTRVRIVSITHSRRVSLLRLFDRIIIIKSTPTTHIRVLYLQCDSLKRNAFPRLFVKTKRKADYFTLGKLNGLRITLNCLTKTI